MYTIAKRFAFSASHIIGGLSADHPCARLHGHNYEVEVVLQSATLDAVGFVRDYGELSAVKDFIDATVDHKHLNDVFGHDRTTAEVIGKWLYDWCKARWPEVVLPQQRCHREHGEIPAASCPLPRLRRWHRSDSDGRSGRGCNWLL